MHIIAYEGKKKCQSVLLTGILSFFIFFVFEVVGGLANVAGNRHPQLL